MASPRVKSASEEMQADDDELGSVPAWLAERMPNAGQLISHPEEFTISVHRLWKKAGGKLAGKPRHSDRFLYESLKAAGSDVRSLTPKLTGKTRIKAEDADALLRLFLSEWPSEDDDPELSEEERVTYAPLATEDEIDAFVSSIAQRFGHEPSLPALLPTETVTDDLPGEDVLKIITTLFERSDALNTVGTERLTIAQNPNTELIGFRNLMNELLRIEKGDGRGRPLIWIYDIGGRRFDDLESRLRYVSAHQLIMRFKALRVFDDRNRDERWKWLERHAIFVVLDADAAEIPNMRGIERPKFLAHNVAFNAIAPEWAKSTSFRTLYGSDLRERLDQRSFSVFYNVEGWPETEDDDDAIRHTRYFGYASFARGPTLEAAKVARGLELPSPGRTYELAYDTIYAAATSVLGLENRLPSALEGSHAIAQLNYMGFRLLRLADFMDL